ncbi:MAG: hypothetical protein HKN87_10475 [Saprospiraceae bacterium]|nr:hypothetical protein [Saprospiraceae bacterium]
MANGNLGMEGNPIPLGNVYVAIRNISQPRTSDNFWSSALYGAGNYYTGKDGKPSQGYVSVPGYGPASFGMD